MKKMKIILILCLTLICVSCKKEPINFINIDSFAVDMSGYDGINSIDHNFEGVSPKEFIRIYKEKGSGAFFIGFKSCNHCQEAAKYINEAAMNTNSKVYYIDAYSEFYPLKDHYDEVFEILFPVLLEDNNGDKVIQTPHFFILINGEIFSSKVGNYDNNKEKTIQKYEKMLNNLKTD